MSLSKGILVDPPFRHKLRVVREIEGAIQMKIPDHCPIFAHWLIR
jgi:hypothetical protein